MTTRFHTGEFTARGEARAAARRAVISACNTILAQAGRDLTERPSADTLLRVRLVMEALTRRGVKVREPKSAARARKSLFTQWPDTGVDSFMADLPRVWVETRLLGCLAMVDRSALARAGCGLDYLARALVWTVLD